MAIGRDRVQALKLESVAGGGDAADELPYPAKLRELEDALSASGFYCQDNGETQSTPDEDCALYRDSAGDWVGYDANHGTPGSPIKVLESAGGGITAGQHNALRQLIHFVDQGPGDGFSSGAYLEQVFSGAALTSAIWYADNTKADKIVELTCAGGIFPTSETWKMYDGDGSTVLVTLVDAITYSGPFEQTRTRTWS